MATQTAQLFEMAPAEAAAIVVHDARSDAWLEAFVELLDAHQTHPKLEAALLFWGLKGDEAASLFGISRQALAKWQNSGVPSDHMTAVNDFLAATDLLKHYLKRDRIPGVVRRRASNLGDRSLLDLAKARDMRGVLEACRAMFDFSRAAT